MTLMDHLLVEVDFDFMGRLISVYQLVQVITDIT